jgi:TIR domain/SIR2-like domain
MSVRTSGVMREEDWTSLTSSIESGRCILMLGPDAFTATFDGETLPVAVALARFVRDRLGPDFAHLDPSTPWRVAQVAVATEDAYTLRGWAEAFYDQYDTVSDTLRALARLPFRLVVNTSPGFSAERAFRDAKRDAFVDFYDRTAAARTELPDATADAPVLYGLYGSLSQPASMILSDHDRFDFLISVITENPPLPRKLTSALCDPSQSFLFLGFNLTQWQLRMLTYVMFRRVQRENKSFAVELEQAMPDEDARLFYTVGQKVHFVDLDLPTLASEIARRVDMPRPAERRRAVPPAVSASSTVFICHTNEDAAFARQLAAELRSNGIGVWLDKDDIRGGDHWDRLVARVLGHEADYVVVLQSRSLHAKDVGYVNKEIDLALERQRYYRPPRIFVIPAIVDDVANQIDELKELQYVDLRGDDGVTELVRAIRRDLDLAGRRP